MRRARRERFRDTSAIPRDLALPGVTVSVTSPNLQGIRSTVTSEIGDYVVTLLPPGTTR